MNQIAAFIVGALFVAGSAFAQTIPLNIVTSTILADLASKAKLSGTQFIECARILEATQGKIGRRLSQDELVGLMPRILPATAAHGSSEPVQTEFGGFLKSVFVQTPNGPKLFTLLRPGDEVVSFDTTKFIFVTNRVHQLHLGTTGSVTGVRQLGAAKFSTLWADATQRFYDPIQSTYSIMNSAITTQNLLLANFDNQPFRFAALKRGPLQEVPTQDYAVFQIELEGEPHNFFAADFLVQSYVAPAGGE